MYILVIVSQFEKHCREGRYFPRYVLCYHLVYSEDVLNLLHANFPPLLSVPILQHPETITNHDPSTDIETIGTHLEYFLDLGESPSLLPLSDNAEGHGRVPAGGCCSCVDY